MGSALRDSSSSHGRPSVYGEVGWSSQAHGPRFMRTEPRDVPSTRSLAARQHNSFQMAYSMGGAAGANVGSSPFLMAAFHVADVWDSEDTSFHPQKQPRSGRKMFLKTRGI